MLNNNNYLQKNKHPYLLDKNNNINTNNNIISNAYTGNKNPIANKSLAKNKRAGKINLYLKIKIN